MSQLDEIYNKYSRRDNNNQRIQDSTEFQRKKKVKNRSPGINEMEKTNLETATKRRINET